MSLEFLLSLLDQAASVRRLCRLLGLAVSVPLVRSTDALAGHRGAVFSGFICASSRSLLRCLFLVFVPFVVSPLASAVFLCMA